MNRAIVKLFMVVILITLNGLAGDNIAEIEAALAREAQAKPWLMAVSHKLLSASGDENTYWATGELKITKGGQAGGPLTCTLTFQRIITLCHLSR